MKRIRVQRAWFIILGIAGSFLAGLWGLSGLATLNSGSLPVSHNVHSLPDDRVFTKTDDVAVLQRELLDYVQADQLPQRVLQVDLAQYPKISQFTDIDSSATGYGKNACGLVAAKAFNPPSTRRLCKPSWAPRMSPLRTMAR